jgi:diguanylate cyclase (GGDEF)-like protein
MRNKAVGLFMALIIVILTSFTYADHLIRAGTTPTFEHLDRRSGLSNLSVSSIVQDRDGFIWFGTQGGLNRYDGRTFKVYSNDPFDSERLIHNLIQTMTYDEAQHELWIGTYQGISRYDIANDVFINYSVDKDGLSNAVVVAFEKDSQGNMWVGTLDGLNKIDIKTGQIKTYDVPGKVVRDLKLDTKGKLWIGSYEGLLYFDEAADAVKTSGYKLPAESVMVINEFEESVLSLGIWDGGIVKINLETGAISQKVFADNRVYSYIKTEDGTEWIGTWGGGLFAVEENGEKHHFEGSSAVNELSHPIVYSMMQDTSGILWIGTNGAGICKVNPLKRNYVIFNHDADDPDSLSAGKINAIERDTANNLWVAVYNEGLDKISPNGQITHYKYALDKPGALTNPNIVDIEKRDTGDLIFAVGSNVMIYHTQQDAFETVIALEPEVIIYELEDVDKKLWIGTYGHGIYRYNWETGEKEHFNYNDDDDTGFQLSDNLVYDIDLDSKGRLWVATNNGLNLKESESEPFQIFRSVPGDYTQLATNTIRVIFEDSKGRIWFGSVGGGLSYYNENGTFTTYLERDGMPSNVVLGILEGDDGRIWASTHNGLTILTPETGDLFNLSPDDGIGGYEFNPGQYRDDSGTLYFGGLHGITSIPGNISEGVSTTPKVYITGVEVYQKPYSIYSAYYNGQHLSFEEDETFLSFKFVALDYDSPEKIRFTYRLKGFDSDWIQSGTIDTATYSKLSSGYYTLEVYAETARGMRSEVSRLTFEIDVPWYRTTTMYSVYSLLVILMLYGIYKIWQGQRTKRKNEALAIVNEKLEDANAKLEALSTIDPLTGVYNRRYLTTRLAEEIQLAIRSEIHLSAIMLDLDSFKEINDIHGHVFGDQYLAEVGSAVRQTLPRSTDYAVRYGGDEFLVILFDTDEAGAKIVAENIRNNISEIAIEDTYLKLIRKTTCSMGVYSLIPKVGIDVNLIAKRADEALYQAKHEGKNRIAVYQRAEENA